MDTPARVLMVLYAIGIYLALVAILDIRYDAEQYQAASLEMASTTRAIESEERDTLNVLACHALNAGQADFINCVNSQ